MSTGAELTADDILAFDDSTIVKVDVKYWNGHVYIRNMRGCDRDLFEQHILESNDRSLKNIRSLFLSLCLCDSKGVLLFKQDQVNSLSEQ